MADAPDNLEPIAKRLWDMMQRVAMQIAGVPLEHRESAFALAERSLRQMAHEMKVADGKIDDLVSLQMDVIRQFVTEIDVGGNPQGGRA